MLQGGGLKIFGPWLFLMLAACGATPEPAYVEQPPEVLYDQAMGAMNEQNYAEAARLFDEVERQHPYSSLATQGQLYAAYSYYLENKYDDAIIALDRFIDLHPGHPGAPYAYYLKALSYYEQITDVGRDQKNTELALTALEDVVNRFPRTPYARDARLKIDLTRDHLAGKEMTIGRYYLTQGYHLAAINRFRSVIEKYQTTTHTAEALHRLTEAYLAIGVVEEAQNTAAVLGHNYPGSEWYQDSYALLTEQNLEPKEKEDSWLQTLF